MLPERIYTASNRNPTDAEPVSFDETVKRALAFCDTLDDDFAPHKLQLAELQTRLSGGRLHFAVLGQFNRGKSTFINALLGIKALPASVLPLTSVPTIIEYGAENRCKIRFLDGQDDLIVNDSPEGIETALRKYVAEESNPKNIFKVRDAAITCKSSLLANGTVLIDTPGFGSTHLHNTQTTLDLLIECDAALFLLSADPPMTQTEMEFLRLVKERVPKIFFILNKIDLLTPEGIDEVDRFIKKLLTTELGFPYDTALYRTCAIKALTANASAPKASPVNQTTDGDTPPPASEDTPAPIPAAGDPTGLEAVKQEIIDFMTREKYFTLSEALQDKYNEVTQSIKLSLEKKLTGILAPFAAAREELNAITSAIQTLGLELESRIKKCADEKDTLDARINTWTKENMESYTLSMKTALDLLLSDDYFPAEAASIASTMLPKHAAGLGTQHQNTMLEFANKLIRTLTMNHTLTFATLQKRYAELLGSDQSVKQLSAEKIIEQLEADTAGQQNISAPIINWPTPQPQITDIFRKKNTRFDAIRQFYEPLCAKSITENIDNAEKHGRLLIDAAWESMGKTIQTAYQKLIDRLKDIHKSKLADIEKEEERVKADIVFLRDKIREIKSIV